MCWVQYYNSFKTFRAPVKDLRETALQLLSSLQVLAAKYYLPLSPNATAKAALQHQPPFSHACAWCTAGALWAGPGGRG